MALAVGMANSEAEFVFPTSEEMGHPLVNVSPGAMAKRSATMFALDMAALRLAMAPNPKHRRTKPRRGDSR